MTFINDYLLISGDENFNMVDPVAQLVLSLVADLLFFKLNILSSLLFVT